MSPDNGTGLLFDIQRFSVHDGPGIRTAVFLKGCPLRCPWCQNPESWEMTPQIMFSANRCQQCWKCSETCPFGAPHENNGKLLLRRELCRNCRDFSCVDTCSSGALRTAGKWMKPEEVVEEVKKDLPFYKNSGGGVTLTGGEPLFQPRFARALLQRCSTEGIHIAVETCGLASKKIFQELFSLSDLVLFDLKIFDPAEHSRLTGSSNEPIIQNAKMLIRSGKEAVFRVPLVPGYTAGEKNLHSIGSFLKEEGFCGTVELLPYHRLGINKYYQLGINPPCEQLQEPGQEQIEKAKTFLQSFGLRCTVGN